MKTVWLKTWIVTLIMGVWVCLCWPAVAAVQPPAVVQLETMAISSMVLLSDGTVKTWGHGANGQLGNGTFDDTSTPGVVPGLANVVALASGDTHAVALLANGKVKAWGGDGFDELGGVTGNIYSTIPVDVPGLDQVIAIDAGRSFTLALLANGTVKAWGTNNSGQLGPIVPTWETSPPVTVEGLNNIVAIAAGGAHALALRGDGTVWSWGDNEGGQLGRGVPGNGMSYPTPAPVVGLGPQRVIAIAAGDAHSLALLADGTVKAWGGNSYGQLGIGGRTDSVTPMTVTGLSQVTSIAAGYWHSLALRVDGTLMGWGTNYNGELGYSNSGEVMGMMDEETPVMTLGLGGSVVACAAGQSHSMALLSDGTVKTWGSNEWGQLGTTLPEGKGNSVTPLTIIAGNGGSRAAPVLSYEINGLNLTISWSAVPGVTSYVLYYAPYPYAVYKQIYSMPMSSRQRVSAVLPLGAAYHIAVVARNPYGYSGYSNIETFTIGEQ